MSRGAGQPSIGYFSMEIALDAKIATYSGGLGVLAGDMLRAAADLGLPMLGVTLLHGRGYFRQHLDASGNQTEVSATWSPEDQLEVLPPRVSILIEGRPVRVQAWRYTVRGVTGHTVPVYLLETGLEENDPWDRQLTDTLYGGDARYRLGQEAVLGLGGIAMLRALGHDGLDVYHLNEGHAALIVLALLEEQTGERGLSAAKADDWEAVRRRCVFTTHTPVPAGHDQFKPDLFRQVLGTQAAEAVELSGCCPEEEIDMTHLALHSSRYTSGVSQRHGQVSQSMFPDHSIHAITNGVHAATWTSPGFSRLYDHHLSGWRRDNLYLRDAVSIPVDEIQRAHSEAKRELLEEVEQRTGRRLNPAVFTIGFARRATAYKRADLLLSDRERLSRIAHDAGPIQVLYAGKAHPQDEDGKELIRRVYQAAAALHDTVEVVYLEDYDKTLAKYLCAGVDLWLNTPQKPLEASGTSGMKAALNGVPSLSVLDGWWLEGHIEGVTGWSIGDRTVESVPSEELASLYNKLEFVVLPLFYGRPSAFAEVMRSTIAVNGSFFNAQRMLTQYVTNAYGIPLEPDGGDDRLME